MRSMRGPLGLLVLTAALFFSLAASAAADTQDIIQPVTPESFDSGFQAGTCTADSEAGLPPEGPPPKRCSVETPGLFFKTASGHPPIGFTQYIIEHAPYTLIAGPGFLAPIPGEDIKEHTIRTLRTDLPPGLTVNPEATPSRCSLAEFLNQPVPGTFVPTCKPETQTGSDKITLVTNKDEVEVGGIKREKGFVIPPIPGGTEIPVYNLVPAEGEPAKLGFVVNAKVPVFLETEVAWENDFHESFTIKLLNTAEASGLSTLISRLVTNGATTGNGTYLTNPTTCFDPNETAFEHLYSTWFRAESHADPANPNFPAGVTAVEGPPPRVPANTGPRIKQEGCETIPFEPSIEADAGTASIDSPAAATVTAKLPFDPEKEKAPNQSQSHVRSAEISLPEGMGLNPSGANGLVACTDAQFKKGQRVETNECPPGSVVGTVEVVSPPLAEPLEGNVYVGEQQSQDPQSGEMFRILIEAKSAHEGIFARLVGNVKANPATGELTAVLTDKIVGQFAGTLPDGLPQVPFETVKMHFDGSKATLTSPPTCSTFEATGQFEPWARPGEQVPVSAKLPTLSSDPGGGSCPQTLAERKFDPGYSASMKDRQAGSFSPFELHIARPDGAQEIRQIDVDLPPGLVAKLKGVEYCPEESIDAAASRSGAAELAAPSCAANSLVGTSGIDAGSGPTPFHTTGTAYLAGPYKGAPISMAFVTPAVAGPFDLGTVVVRAALNVDPETAEVHAVSDPIPYVFGGVKLDIRKIDVAIDRQDFTLNPTTCRQAFAIAGGIFGGGGNPADPASWFESKPSSEYRATNCKALKYKPKFEARILGGKGHMQRGDNPKFRAILDARKGDANTRRAAFILPNATILDQGHIKTICTRVQLAANACPKGSIYGNAQATSPLLDGKLKGPVYLTSSDNPLPDLLVDLKGQVNVRLRGVISSEHGRLKTVFRNTPDVAVDKFTLTMKGGAKGLLVNTRNLCSRQTTGFLNLGAQNSRREKRKNLKLRIPAC
ncbi:MAG TPA: hypothetical protein VIS95_03375 [Solirubrobacterales bacterium]